MATCITPDTIADLLEQAPIWALSAMATPNELTRKSGRRVVAEHVYHALFQPVNTDTAQLPLPL